MTCGSGGLLGYHLTLLPITVIVPTWLLTIKPCQQSLPFWIPLIPDICEPSSVLSFPIVGPGIQKTSTTELLSDAPVFLIALVNGVSSWPFHRM